MNQIKDFLYISKIVVCILLCTTNQRVLAKGKETYTHLQGLPSNFIYQSGVNAEGLLFAATQKGIVQFDGYHFQQTTWAKGNTAALFIKGDDIYFHNYTEGLVRYNFQSKQRTVLLQLDYEDARSDNDHYDNIYVDAENRVWSSDFSAVKYWSRKTKRIQRFVLNGKHSASFRSQFYELPDNRMLVAATIGLYEIDLGKNEVHCLSPLSYSSSFRTGTDYITLLSRNVLYQYSTRTADIKEYCSIKNEGIMQGLCTTQAGTLLLYSQNSIYEISSHSCKPTLITRLERTLINSVQVDNASQSLWIATNKGLVQYRLKQNGIEILKTGNESNEDINTNIVQDSDKNIWVSGARSFGIFDSFKTFRAIPFNARFKQINTLFCATNKIYIATDDGLYTMNDNRLTATNVKGTFKKIALDAHHNFWLIDTANQVRVFDSSGKEQAGFLNKQPDTFWKENIWNDIFIDKLQQVWLAGYTPKSFGIAKYNPSEQAFSSIAKQNKSSDFIGDYYNRIAPYGDSALLFSGYGGFNIVASTTKIIATIKGNQYHIDNEHIEGIGADRKQHIFLGTGEGLGYFNTGKRQVATLTELDGLASNDVIYGFANLGEDRIAIGSAGEITIIDSRTAFNTSLINRLKLTGVQIGNTQLPVFNDTILLTPLQHNVTLSFSALNYEIKEKVFYAYRLNGGPWINLYNNPSLSFNQVASGNYTIEIRAQDNLGNLQKKTLTINLVAETPFYKKWWFNVAVLLISTVLVWLLAVYIYSRKRKIEQLSAKVKEVEMQTLRAQMNPHFLFNSLNSIKGFILENKTELANEYLTKFSKLMRSILENSRMKQIALEKELATLDWYIQLESARLEHIFDYRISVSENVDSGAVLVPPLILQPFVENAIWHGLRSKPNGFLEITIAGIEQAAIKIKIQDNGIGRVATQQNRYTPKKEHNSLGIGITKERLLSHNIKNSITITDLYDSAENPAGTLVELIIYPDND